MGSGQLTSGPVVMDFEKRLAAFLGVEHVVAVANGTAALHLMLLAAGVGAASEVVVPSYTFAATASAVLLAGGRAVLSDVRPETANLDPSLVTDLLTPASMAVMPVHQFGLSCEWDDIAGSCGNRGLALLEDAACALGARYRGRRCGSLGLAAAFSFHPRKILTTGEGGAIATGDSRLADEVRLLRNHGMVGTGLARRFLRVGYNLRMSDLNAAVGLAQLEFVDDVIGRRQELAKIYRRHLSGLAVDVVDGGDHTPHTFQTFAVILPQGVRPAAVVEALASDGIEAAQGAQDLSQLGLYGRQASMPGAQVLGNRLLALPMHTSLTDGDLAQVVESLGRAIAVDR